MSIVLLVRSLNIGGAQRQLVNLATGLHAKGVVVTVVAFYDTGVLLNELERAGVRVKTIGKRGRWDVVVFMARLIRVLRRERPDIIYAFLVEPNLVALLVKPFVGRPRVVWGVRASNMNLGLYGWMPRITYRLTRRLARFADLIIANSWAGAAYHAAQGYPRRKIVVVPNGIDVERFRPDPEGGQRMRAMWNIPAHAVVIGMVGRVDHMKDHATLIQATAHLVRRGTDVVLVLVGEGPADHRAQLESQVAVLGLEERVVWAGTHDDMAQIYNSFDVCCLSSSFGEGFPNALGEAMACGVPCVATDVGDAARILSGCGVIVPPGDSELLADGIQRALLDARPGRTQASRERVVHEYSLTRMVESTEQQLRDCVDASS